MIVQTIDIHGYADDHGIKSKFKAKWNDNKIELETIQRLESCLEDVKACMDVKSIKDEQFKNRIHPIWFQRAIAEMYSK